MDELVKYLFEIRKKPVLYFGNRRTLAHLSNFIFGFVTGREGTNKEIDGSTNWEKTESRVKNILESSKNTINEEINLHSLKAYLNTKYPDRKNNKDKDFSSLITELTNIGIHNISELEDMHKQTWEIFLM